MNNLNLDNMLPKIEETGPDARTPEPEGNTHQNKDNAKAERVNGDKNPEQIANNGRRSPEKAWKKYNAKSISGLADEPIDEDLYLLGDGWLERGSGGFIVAGSGVGKSVLSFQMATLWACGRGAFGILPTRALKIVIFQAEDGENDQRRMSRMFHKLGLSDKEKKVSAENCRVIFCNDVAGDGFLSMANGYLEDNGIDLVIINPLNSYLDGAAIDEENAKDFLRVKLNPILVNHRVGCLIMHHTPKQNYRDTSGWNASAFMYAMAGHADLTNWARCIITIEPTNNDPGVFKFIASKRGQLIGWEQIIRYWKHAEKNTPWMWVEADQATVDSANAPKGAITPQDIRDILKGRIDPVHKDEILKKARAKGFKNEREFNAAIEEGDGKLFFKDIIRDGGIHKRYGYLTSEPCYDFARDLEALIPKMGIKEDDLIKKAKLEHGYYSDEAKAGIQELLEQCRVEARGGDGRNWAQNLLFRKVSHPTIAMFAPSGEVTVYSLVDAPVWHGHKGNGK